MPDKDRSDKDAFISLLSQKKELVFQLLRMANDTDFNEKDNDANAEKFIAFVDAREVIIDQLKALDAQIAKLRENPGVLGEFGSVDREIREMTDQIARVELDISKKTLDIMTRLQQDIKDMNKRKRMSIAYDSASSGGRR